MNQNSNMEIYQVFETIRKANLVARQRNDYDKLLENAQALSDYIPQIIEILVDQENKYRKFEANLLSEDKMTSSKAETLAKATDFYKEFRKAELTLDWSYATINISKKIASSVTNEFKSTLR